MISEDAPSSPSHPTWNRRAWLATNVSVLLATRVSSAAASSITTRPAGARERVAGMAAANRRAELVDPATLETLAQRAVDAAKAAGAQYADARLTRIVSHKYVFNVPGGLSGDNEEQGFSVRALFDGRWGFTASPVWSADEAVRIAQNAVLLAKANARASASVRRAQRVVDLGRVPAVTGRWATPITIDPFTVPVEEKADAITYWNALATQYGTGINQYTSYLLFARQERVVATTDGSLFHQTTFESGGAVILREFAGGSNVEVPLRDLDMTARGWEYILAANIPEQLRHGHETILAELAMSSGAKPNQIGTYTVVCDGHTMASILDESIGTATQLDRALGYEANAGGTSYVTDPLHMVGNLQIAAPLVTVTGNRSTAGQLATVQWDDEGVVPTPFTLVKDGILTDFQTTREQSGWLASYYQGHGMPVRSHGCAASENALRIPIQHIPNLALEPSARTPQAASVSVEDLIANVAEGIFVEGGMGLTDYQARTGLVAGSMRRIRQGRLGPRLAGGAILFNSKEFWKNVSALGGPSTAMTISTSQYQAVFSLGRWVGKGQPAQMTSRSVRAVAATITNQPIIDPFKRA